DLDLACPTPILPTHAVAGGHVAAVATDGHAEDGQVAPALGGQHTAGPGVPERQLALVFGPIPDARGDEAVAAGGEGQADDDGREAPVGEPLLPALRVAEHQLSLRLGERLRPGPAAGGDVAAVGAERQGLDQLGAAVW